MNTHKTLIFFALAISLTVTAVSCGSAPTENASDIIQVDLGIVTALDTAKIQKENDTAAVSLSSPPAVGISYQYKVGGEGLVAAHRITSGNFSWTVMSEDGLVGQTTHADGLRPCDNPNTQHISLEKVKDYGYVVDISLETEIIQSYTLKAYPVGNYDVDGTECLVRDGKLDVLKGKYYYELIIEYHQGKVVYGFFID